MTIVQPNLSVWNGGNSFYKKIVKIVITQHWKILPAFLIYYLHLEERLETQSVWQSEIFPTVRGGGGLAVLLHPPRLISVFFGDLILILVFGWLRVRLLTRLTEYFSYLLLIPHFTCWKERYLGLCWSPQVAFYPGVPLVLPWCCWCWTAGHDIRRARSPPLPQLLPGGPA